MHGFKQGRGSGRDREGGFSHHGRGRHHGGRDGLGAMLREGLRERMAEAGFDPRAMCDASAMRGAMAERFAMGPFGGRGFGRGGFGGDGLGGPGGFGGGFGGDGSGRDGRDGMGRGRRGKRFGGEELRLMVLSLIGEEARHGYQLIRAFAEKSGDVYQPSPGVLYPLLAMLAEMGLIAEVAGEEGGRRRFALTAEGEAELAAKRAEVEALFARLAAFAEHAGRTDGAPVRRAVHNLRSALVERLGREGAAEDLVFEVARIIDEATQKIERL